jgi:hypothetical protein
MGARRSLTIFSGMVGVLCLTAVSADAFRVQRHGDISVFTKQNAGEIIEVETNADREKAKQQHESGAVEDVKVGAKMTGNAIVETTKSILYQSPLGIFFTPKNGRRNYQSDVGGPMVFEPGYPTLQSELTKEDW